MTAIATQLQEQFTLLKGDIERIRESVADVRKNNRALTDAIEDLRLDHNKRFDKMQASQDQLQAQISNLRVDISDLRQELFHETGSRETVDESIYDVTHQNYREPNQRLKRLEDKISTSAPQVA